MCGYDEVAKLSRNVSMGNRHIYIHLTHVSQHLEVYDVETLAKYEKSFLSTSPFADDVRTAWRSPLIKLGHPSFAESLPSPRHSPSSVPDYLDLLSITLNLRLRYKVAR